MSARLIDGRKIASDIKKVLKNEVAELNAKGIKPCLAVVFDGTDPSARKYVTLKIKACEEIGIDILIHSILKATIQKDLVKFIQRLNANPKVNGILVQFPLPTGLDKNVIISKISSEKDVDSCGPYAINNLINDESYFISCAPYGVIKMLEAYGIKLNGKLAVIVENSQMGKKEKFLAYLLSKKNAAVTTCSSKASNLKEECLKADILCVAVGMPEMITADMVKDGATVIDLGMNLTPEGKITGDVDFRSVKEKAAYITPVPGGAGPMTIAMLMYNTVLAAKRQNRIDSNA